MRANLVGPDGVKVTKPDSGDVPFVFEVSEDLQRDEVVFVRVVVPVELFLRVVIFSLGGWGGPLAG